jgi:hypothetical protein
MIVESKYILFSVIFPIGQLGNIQCLGEPGFTNPQGFLSLLSFGDIFCNTKQVFRLAVHTINGSLTRVDIARTLMCCGESLLRDIQHFLACQCLAILRCEEICFFLWEEIIVIFAKHRFLREANQFFGCPVPAKEP